MRHWLLLPLCGLLSSCAYHYPLSVSSTSLGEKFETPVRTATGVSRAYYVLGMRAAGNDSLNAAIEDALSYGPADSLVNAYADRKATCYPAIFLPLVCRVDTAVFGTLVKYKDAQGNPLPQGSLKTERDAAPRPRSMSAALGNVEVSFGEPPREPLVPAAPAPASGAANATAPSQDTDQLREQFERLPKDTVILVTMADGKKVKGKFLEVYKDYYGQGSRVLIRSQQFFMGKQGVLLRTIKSFEVVKE